ncbi:hypothetical protein GOBAR_AA29795 [Gossypium barbadense]|uniref:Uncharacterized protein n=1 Tax=Gossypium barbadense TaxID=3634 RepID=A0A2P5WIH4_GOSBA|nr:hypothetical protein GOBAR_AA29795 [Gossypium barbadense]
MAASSSREAMNKQLLDFIHSMEQEGLVDYRFAKVHMLKESSGPFFFASLLPTFCRDSTATLRDLTVALGQPLLNYHDLALEFVVWLMPVVNFIKLFRTEQLKKGEKFLVSDDQFLPIL